MSGGAGGRPAREARGEAGRIPAPGPAVGALVLAAGRSTRMGDANKLLATLDGLPFVVRVAEAALAARVAQVLVVTGHEAERIEAALAGRPVSFAFNRHFAQGMATSIRCGLAALRQDLEAAVVLLGDMPRVTAGAVDRLVAAFDPADPRIVVPVREGRRGNPVLWPRRYFREMLELTGDAGARGLIGRHADRVTAVPFETDAIFADADTPEALAALGAAPGEPAR
ncbi:MAG: nucleotidyltransferase family protein [Rhodocyclaceae bacterium]|nr:nucleotidyltransferase family protein [Rhodocyclaceae bacterium]